MRDSTFVIILLGCVILLSITVALAFGDYIPYLLESSIKSEKPIICIYEPFNPKINFDGLKVLDATKYAIWEWQYKLEQYTNEPNGWDFDIRYYNNTEHKDIPYQDFNCDIHIRYGLTYVTDDPKKKRAGEMFAFDYPYSYALIEVYTHRLDSILLNEHSQITNMNITQRNVNTIRIIVTHELGHAFGLNHLIQECQGLCVKLRGAYVNADAEISIMYAGVSIEHQNRTGIKDVDLRAIITKYSDDGWGGYNRMGTTMYWWPN